MFLPINWLYQPSTESWVRSNNMTDLENYSIKILDKQFEGDVSKEVYLQACKWLATHVYNSPSYSENISVKIVKSNKEVEKLVRHKKTGKIEKTKQTRTVFTVSLYCVRSLKDAIDEHCKNCKQLHTIFYMAGDCNCNECKMNVFKNKMEHDLKGLADSLKESFEKEDG